MRYRGWAMRSRIRSGLKSQCVVLLFVLLGAACAGAIGGRDRMKITVLVNNSTRVSARELGQAEREASRVFRAAGIEITWVDCSVVKSACRRAPGSDQFVLHIVPNGKTSSDLVFGVAFLGEDGSGKYCNVFFDRIAEIYSRLGGERAQLLGNVAAHELGHLILGSQAHSLVGIMSPVWQQRNMREIGMGTFLFTREQSALMKSRIGRDEMGLDRVRARAEY